MIFHFHNDFLTTIDPAEIPEICRDVIKNDNLINVDAEGFKVIDDNIKRHGATKDKEIWSKFFNDKGVSVNATYRKYLTTIEVIKGYDVDKLKYLACQSGIVFMENGVNEWPVYIWMADCYKRDPVHGRAFELLHAAMDPKKRRIVADEVGGTGQLLDLYDKCEPTQPRRAWLDEKSLCLFDRDSKRPKMTFPTA